MPPKTTTLNNYQPAIYQKHSSGDARKPALNRCTWIIKPQTTAAGNQELGRYRSSPIQIPNSDLRLREEDPRWEIALELFETRLFGGSSYNDESLTKIDRPPPIPIPHSTDSQKNASKAPLEEWLFYMDQ